ncbi:MAG: TerC family protein, partial [Methylocapsa sp.]|nr:TerC family protein [Methylocapsa sp.]
GGLFLVFKATLEIHHAIEPFEAHHSPRSKHLSFRVTAGQIVLIDLVFSIDSIITAVGMTEHVPIMIGAVIIAVLLMLGASGPLAGFIRRNPTVVMLALGFLLLIGSALIADGFGFHLPRGYVYAAMAFSAAVEGLNMLARNKRAAQRREEISHASPKRGERKRPLE